MTAPHLGPGHTVAGRYTVRALLGFTGESATYHAQSASGQEVVIKLYDPALGQRADVMGELERVRNRLASLPPGGVVPVLDGGYDAGTGAPYEVTEYLSIPSLASLIAQQALPAPMVARILQGMGQILDQAQSQQLSHFALKPTNIFVGPAPHHQVRITDFAVSVVRRASPTHEAYAHSAPWWAPEQLQPAAHLGPATDVFTSALVAFHALTGRSYWLSCQRHPPDLGAWQAEVMGERFPVSQRARELGAVINPAVDPTFARALSVSQADRPRSVSELAAALAGSPAGAAQEAAKTLAFPEMGFPETTPGADAGYTPPPAFGGEAPPPGAAEPAAATPPPAEASGGTPGLPPIPPAKKKAKKGNTIPIVIGVMVALIVGGVVAGFYLWDSDGTNEPSAASTASASAQPATAPGVGGSGGSAGADGAGGAGGAEASAGGAGEGGAPSEEPKTIEATITCKPACDEIYVDDEKIDKQGEPIDLVPGRHVVKATKRGYVTRVDDNLVVPEEGPFSKEYVLNPIRVAPRPRPCDNQFIPCK